MTTRAQIESNRRNAKKSTGPKSERGKQRSRGNSMKDGLAGAGVVLAPADEAEIERLLPEYQKIYGTDDAEKQVLLRRLVFESVRLDRCVKAEFATRKAVVQRARLAWDEDRAAEAAALGLKISARPAAVAGELRRGLFGCFWLYDRWTVLRDVLETKEDWDDDERNLALDLLGIDNELRKPGLTSVDRPAEGVSPGDHRFALADAEMERLVELIDGPMSELDQADQARAINDATLFQNPAVLRIHRAEQKAFRNFMRLRNELKSAERRESAEPVPPAAPVVEPVREPATIRPATAASKPAPASPPSAAAPSRPINRKQRRAMEKQVKQAMSKGLKAERAAALAAG